jgi:hypothetical protein
MIFKNYHGIIFMPGHPDVDKAIFGCNPWARAAWSFKNKFTIPGFEAPGWQRSKTRNYLVSVLAAQPDGTHRRPKRKRIFK